MNGLAMNIFGVAEAKHYCGTFQHTAGDPAGSLTKYVAGPLKAFGSLKEGTPEFNNYRDCALREVERCLFLSISNYRRALDLMMPGASSWAHVTLYYSSYLAARALLGMFGAWVGMKVVVEVAASQPGSQELVLNRKKAPGGSHERFWGLFYAAMPSLEQWVDGKLRFAITPISGQVAWQTQVRNDVNYDSFLACELAANFQNGFTVAKFPTSLPGSLNTQFSVTEALLVITTQYVREFGLMTDALNALMPAGNRKTKIQRLVFRDHAPRLVQKTAWRSILT